MTRATPATASAAPSATGGAACQRARSTASFVRREAEHGRERAAAAARLKGARGRRARARADRRARGRSRRAERARARARRTAPRAL